MATLDRQAIESRLPHAGNMCLLDRVESSGTSTLVCKTATHLDENNPLRVNGGLPASAALEYAAQAMALHAGDPDGPPTVRRGVLAAARDFEMLVDRLDTVSGELEIVVERFLATDQGLVYGFHVNADNRPLARGQATILFVEKNGD